MNQKKNSLIKLKLLSKMRKAIKESMTMANRYISNAEQDRNLAEQDRNLLNSNSREETNGWKYPNNATKSATRIQAIIRGWLGRLKYKIKVLESRMNEIEQETNERIMNVKIRAQNEKVSHWKKINLSHKDEELKKRAAGDTEMDTIKVLQT